MSCSSRSCPEWVSSALLSPCLTGKARTPRSQRWMLRTLRVETWGHACLPKAGRATTPLPCLVRRGRGCGSVCGLRPLWPRPPVACAPANSAPIMVPLSYHNRGGSVKRNPVDEAVHFVPVGRSAGPALRPYGSPAIKSRKAKRLVATYGLCPVGAWAVDPSAGLTLLAATSRAEPQGQRAGPAPPGKVRQPLRRHRLRPPCISAGIRGKG